MNIGYARTSTLDQTAGYEAQLRALEDAGCNKVFQEQVSSVAQRAQLDAALDFMREGDTLIVTQLDRLARSTKHLGEIVEAVKARGVHLRILALGIDTASATGELVLNLLGSVAQFERQMMLERQREGIAKAKGEGKYKGRKPTSRAKAPEIMALREAGKGASAIAKELGIGRTSVYRVLAQADRAGEEEQRSA